MNYIAFNIKLKNKVHYVYLNKWYIISWLSLNINVIFIDKIY